MQLGLQLLEQVFQSEVDWLILLSGRRGRACRLVADELNIIDTN
jgi:hypothetical protein